MKVRERNGGPIRFGAEASRALGAGAEPAGRAGARLGDVRLARVQHRQPRGRRDRRPASLADHGRRHGRRPASGAGAQAAREDRHGREGPRHLERGLRRARPDADQDRCAAGPPGRDPGAGGDLPRPDRRRRPRADDDRDLGPGEEDRGVHRRRSGRTASASWPGPAGSPWSAATGPLEGERADGSAPTGRARPKHRPRSQGHSEL